LTEHPAVSEAAGFDAEAVVEDLDNVEVAILARQGMLKFG
jgi:hypothetical protein